MLGVKEPRPEPDTGRACGGTLAGTRGACVWRNVENLPALVSREAVLGLVRKALGRAGFEEPRYPSWV